MCFACATLKCCCLLIFLSIEYKVQHLKGTSLKEIPLGQFHKIETCVCMYVLLKCMANWWTKKMNWICINVSSPFQECCLFCYSFVPFLSISGYILSLSRKFVIALAKNRKWHIHSCINRQNRFLQYCIRILMKNILYNANEMHMIHTQKIYDWIVQKIVISTKAQCAQQIFANNNPAEPSN